MTAEMLRKRVARDIQDSEISYEFALSRLEEYQSFDNWDNWELENRPVDLEELKDIIWNDLFGC